MKIGVIGALGLPAKYGIDRHCEELYSRLVRRGHDVTIYCRSYYTAWEGSYKGISLRRVPVCRARGWETFGYSLMASLDALGQGFDLVHYHSITSAGFCFMPRLRGIKVVVTIHSFDRRHSKWGIMPRTFLWWSEWAAVNFSHTTIAVSKSLKQDIEQRYALTKPISYIPNGVLLAARCGPTGLAEFGLSSGRYVLYVGRLVPEKGVHLLVQAFQEIDDYELVIVGGTRHSKEYVQQLKAIASPNVRFLGYISGDKLATLYSHAHLFVAPAIDEGFGLTVLEAMSYGVCVLVSDIPVHRETIQDTGYFFRSGDAAGLAQALRSVLRNPAEMKAKAQAARRRVEQEYQWDQIAAATEQLLLSLC